MLNLPLPSNEILSEYDWNEYLVENVPALATLWEQGKFDQFETYKTLAGHSYNEYMLLAPRKFMAGLVDVQPMTDPTGEIFTLRLTK
jgi:hypothetical protein